MRVATLDLEAGRIFFLIASVTLLLSGVSTAAAQSAEFDRWSFSLGIFFADRATNTRLDGEVPGSGTDIDSEVDLGFDKSDSVFRFDGAFRFNEKHRIDFSAFDLSRTGSKQITEDIIWGGTTYPIDTLANADFGLKIYKLAYTWSFMVRERGYLGVTGGLYIADIGMSIAANKVNGIRAALANDPVSAAATRRHNDANVLCLGARIIGADTALACVDAFLDTEFEPGDDGRHKRRVAMIADLECT